MAPEGINQGVGCLLWALLNKEDRDCSRVALSGPTSVAYSCASTLPNKKRTITGDKAKKIVSWRKQETRDSP